jgi:hypothetical protein
MSMNLMVLLPADQSPTIEAWQRALTEPSLPVRFSSLPDLTRSVGCIPVSLRGQPSCFYFFHESYAEACTHYPLLASVKLQQPVIYSLQYGGDFWKPRASLTQPLCWSLGSVGVAFDPQGAIFVSEEQLLDGAGLFEALAKEK